MMRWQKSVQGKDHRKSVGGEGDTENTWRKLGPQELCDVGWLGKLKTTRRGLLVILKFGKGIRG